MAIRKRINLVWNILLLICLVVLVILIITFGFTFGTLFFLSFFVFLVTIRLVNILSMQRRNSKAITLVKNIINLGFIIFIISFFVIEALIISESISKQDHIVEADYVIILGAGLEGDQLSKRLEKRLIKGLEYLKNNENSKVIVSGGQGEDEYISEAEAMGRYLLENGIEKDRISSEDRSTSTLENLLFSRRIIASSIDTSSTDASNTDTPNPQITDPKILIVTSDYHMYRAIMIAEQLGMNCQGFASDSELAVKANYLIREYFALLKDMIILKVGVLPQGVAD